MAQSCVQLSVNDQRCIITCNPKLTKLDSILEPVFVLPKIKNKLNTPSSSPLTIMRAQAHAFRRDSFLPVPKGIKMHKTNSQESINEENGLTPCYKPKKVQKNMAQSQMIYSQMNKRKNIKRVSFIERLPNVERRKSF